MDLRISTADLSQLIGDIYHATLTDQWDAVLAKLIDFTHSNKAFFSLQQLNKSKPLIINIKSNFNMPKDSLAAYQARATEDPGYELTRFMTEGEWMHINRHMDVNAFHDTSFYKDIYQPLKVHHALMGLLCRDGKHEALFAVNRAADEHGYSVADENLIALITPHFSRAIHIYKELRLHRNYSNLTKSILDQEDKGIFVCTSEGKVLIENEYAKENLSLPCPIYTERNYIKVSQPVYHQQLYHYIAQCAALAYQDIGLQETILIESESFDDMLITVSPLLKQHQFIEICTPCSLITVKSIHKTNWKQVQKEFGLTPKELKLVKGIYYKKKLNELAKDYGVSYNTLRNHLQSVFKKMGINSQTAMLSKLNLF